jgi:hypothetical protein
MSDQDPFQYPAEGSADPAEEDFSGLPEAESPLEPPISADPVAAEDNGMSWYIIHTYSGLKIKWPSPCGRGLKRSGSRINSDKF